MPRLERRRGRRRRRPRGALWDASRPGRARRGARPRRPWGRGGNPAGKPRRLRVAAPRPRGPGRAGREGVRATRPGRAGPGRGRAGAGPQRARHRLAGPRGRLLSRSHLPSPGPPADPWVAQRFSACLQPRA
ncbi:unnamed protein product [Nyctereutes procyonoides]|uniref:(raccoon dog) hypothetical protein n=1 Tax=Nyctereutes procyonoides TaxID=34880 RepID=A0A811Y8T7_NYCPR|nr:unnamed protein product [Nyctereutes procyonoides]